jgi:hypothetical protein
MPSSYPTARAKSACNREIGAAECGGEGRRDGQWRAGSGSGHPARTVGPLPGWCQLEAAANVHRVEQDHLPAVERDALGWSPTVHQSPPLPKVLRGTSLVPLVRWTRAGPVSHGLHCASTHSRVARRSLPEMRAAPRSHRHGPRREPGPRPSLGDNASTSGDGSVRRPQWRSWRVRAGRSLSPISTSSPAPHWPGSLRPPSSPGLGQCDGTHGLSKIS